VDVRTAMQTKFSRRDPIDIPTWKKIAVAAYIDIAEAIILAAAASLGAIFNGIETQFRFRNFLPKREQVYFLRERK